MSDKITALKEKFRLALTSTAKVIADDLDLANKQSENEKKQELKSIEIENFTLSDSNLNIRYRLSSIGVRVINNVVDYTNYVLHDIGQPLHAFDRDKLFGTISVRFAKDNENLKLIGGIMDEEVLDQAGVQNVASLPTLDEARANIVGILNAPASKLVSIFLAYSEKMSNLSSENSETQPKE